MRNKKFKKGVSIIDMIVAGMIVPILVSGTLSYRYYTVQSLQKAHRYLEAAELSVFMNNAWKGVGGAETFDPVVLGGNEMKVAISSAGAIDTPTGHIPLNQYDVVSDGITYSVKLSYKDVDPKLRELHSTVLWSFNGANNTCGLTTFVYRN